MRRPFLVGPGTEPLAGRFPVPVHEKPRPESEIVPVPMPPRAFLLSQGLAFVSPQDGQPAKPLQHRHKRHPNDFLQHHCLFHILLFTFNYVSPADHLALPLSPHVIVRWPAISKSMIAFGSTLHLLKLMLHLTLPVRSGTNSSRASRCQCSNQTDFDLKCHIEPFILACHNANSHAPLLVLVKWNPVVELRRIAVEGDDAAG